MKWGSQLLQAFGRHFPSVVMVVLAIALNIIQVSMHPADHQSDYQQAAHSIHDPVVAAVYSLSALCTHSGTQEEQAPKKHCPICSVSDDVILASWPDLTVLLLKPIRAHLPIRQQIYLVEQGGFAARAPPFLS